MNHASAANVTGQLKTSQPGSDPPATLKCYIRISFFECAMGFIC